jgi:DNA-binding NtrC family response regulator
MSTAVLIVDDVRDWREMLAGLVSDCFPDVDVTSAESFDAAKQALQERAYKLAILDVRLDETDEENVDGLDLMAYIAEFYPDTTAIIVTGYATWETVERAMRPDQKGMRDAFDLVKKENIIKEFVPRISAVLDSEESAE